MPFSIPGVLVRHDPTGPALPLVLDSPHSGDVYPEDFDHSAPRMLVRQAEDAFIDDLFGAAPGLGATLIGALFPRAYIDANRSLMDIDEALLDAPWPDPVSPGVKTRSGIGLVWRLARPGVPMYARKLSVQETRARIDRYWRPYHAAVADAVEATHAAHGVVWHINCHSMQAVGGASMPDAGRRRADFVLGDRDGSTCSPSFTHFVAERLRARGYSVAINDPYKGVELVRLHGRPAEGRHSLQIEVNRSLYMHETEITKLPAYDKVRADISAVLAEIARFIRERQPQAS